MTYSTELIVAIRMPSVVFDNAIHLYGMRPVGPGCALLSDGEPVGKRFLKFEDI